MGREKEGEPATTSAYLLYANFGEKFPSNGTGIFWAPKTGTGLSCTIYKIQANFPLSLGLKPGTGNPNIWCRKFRSFRYKREKGITFFVACSKRSDGGERCEVKKAMKSRGGLGREVQERL